MAGRPKAFDPDEALGRALDLFWQRGYEATSLHALLDAMQIGRQSLYNTYGGKDALYRQALQRYGRERLSLVREHLEQPGSPLDHIRGLFEMWVSMASAQPFRGCFMHNTIVEVAQRVPEWRELARQHLSELEGLFVGALERAQAAGELPETYAVRARARALIAAFHGLLALGKVGMDAAFIRDVAAAAVAPLEG